MRQPGHRQSAITSPPSTTNEDSSYHRQFVYDTAGNWDWFTLGSDPNTPYVPNALNLYDSINDPNDPNTPTESFTYDKDQNLTEVCGTGVSPVKYAYDADNRLIEVVPAEDDPNNLTADDKKLVFTYDYLNRRVRKVVYAWDPNEGESGDWSATAELDLRFIYHERLLLLELDGLDSNAKVRKHVWGPGTNGRLGGLNSLLGVRDIDSSTNYVCFNNGTGSVAQLLDRSDASIDAKYDKYGGGRAQAQGPCIDPDIPGDCDMCGPCFQGIWVLEPLAAWEFYEDPIRKMCKCGPSSGNPGRQRRRRGPDDPCVTGAGYCGGCAEGTSLPGWIIVDCYSWPEEEEEECPAGAYCQTSQPEKRKLTDQEICEKACGKGGACDGFEGCVMCTPDHRPIACACTTYGGTPGRGVGPPDPCGSPTGANDCVYCHEQAHIDREFPLISTCEFCDDPAGCRPELLAGKPAPLWLDEILDCLAYRAELRCLDKIVCQDDPTCEAEVEDARKYVEREWKVIGCGDVNWSVFD